MSAPPAAARLDAQIRDLRLFDGNRQIGPSDFTVFAAPTSVARLTAEIYRHGIAEAVVYHASAGAYGPAFGNATLVTGISSIPRLHGCWVVLPHDSREMPGPAVLEPKVESGAAELRFRTNDLIDDKRNNRP
jgi:hypothetical protein